MQRFEYKVIPAPRRAEKQRGLKTTEDRFAHALTEVMNSLGRDGWEYIRADTLPCEEKSGFTGKSTSFQNMLVFRRVIEAGATQVVAVPEQPAIPTAPVVYPPATSGAPALGPAVAAE